MTSDPGESTVGFVSPLLFGFATTVGVTFDVMIILPAFGGPGSTSVPVSVDEVAPCGHQVRLKFIGLGPGIVTVV